MDVLEKIVLRKHEELAERKRRRPVSALRDHAWPALRDFAGALRADGMSVIAEFKRRSPSKGEIGAGLVLGEVVQAYERGGARALSILTDESFFGGSDADLSAAREVTGLPVLRKDFTLDPYHVIEARAVGADAVLLIVRILGDGQMRELLAAARELGLAALVEVHDAAELERALAAGATIIGVNNRDLRTFEVRLERCIELRGRMPAGCVSVAESGICSRADVERIEAAGFEAMLVGESLLISGDPGAKVAELLGRGAGGGR